MLPSKVCTVNEDGEEGRVCWEGKKKKRCKGRRRLLECGRSGWGKTPGPAVDFHPPQYGRRYLSKSSLFIFYPVLFILRVAELLVTWTVQRFMPDATFARYCMYLCRLSNNVSFRSLLCVSFHQCCRGFGTDKSGLLSSARRRRCCLH